MTKHAGGRPTKLTPELMLKAYAYETKDAIPTIEDFAIYLEINRDTVYDWKKNNPEFSDIVNRILALQAKTLINKGLKGEFNPTITKLILSGKHGYVERSEQELTHHGDVTFINDVPRPKE